MAAAGGPAPHDIELALEREPWKFSFFQALRRLECAHSDKPRIGASTRLVDDPVRLGQEVSLIFAPSTLAAFQRRAAGLPSLLQVRFFGLFGPNGALPLHLTDYVHDRIHNEDDPTIARFADLFHHRLLSVLYRAWAIAKPTVSHDRPQEDRFSGYVGSLFGIGMDSLRNRDEMPDRAKLFFSGRFACQSRHPEGLVAVLASFFSVPVDLKEFVGQWLALPKTSICRMGESPETGTLGVSLIVGSRIWDRQQKFRIVLGPMGYADFERLLPGGESLPRLIAVVRNYIGDELEWDLNMILKKEEVPPLKLGEQGRLGWTTWLTSQEFEEDVKDLYLSPLEHVA